MLPTKYTPKDLRPYQWRTIRYVLERKCAALFIDMGLGKTISVLSIIKALLHAGKIDKPVLIVAPIRVIYTVWRQEAALWSHTRRLTFSIVHGSPEKRLQALRTPANIYLVSADGLRWLLELLKNKKALANWPFSMLVIDESSAFKAPGTKRFSKLRHFLHLFEYRIPMTGTPRPNHLLEIWPQIFIVDRGERLGTSSSRFRDRFFYPADHQGYTYEARPRATRYIMHAISDVVLSMDAADWKAVPPTVHNTITVQLPRSVRALYEEFEEQMFLELETGDVEAVNAAVLSSKCHQIANGAIYTEDDAGNKQWEPLHDAKLEALAEVVEETGSPVLVAYHFKHDLVRLRAMFPRAPILGNMKTIERTVEQWNAGKIPVLLAHPKSAGHGLNLQHGPGHTIVFFSLTWSRELYDQLISRIGGARAQQRVMVHHIMCADTTDEAIMDSTAAKGAGQSGFLAGLRALQAYKRRRQHGVR